MKMALRRVDLSTDVYFVCLNHAMCTEGEEIVGLLVGEVDEERVAHVVAVLILRRSDKRKDRVEISPEQLSNASTEAEKLACIMKRPVRVVGWYHSHPKLTVYPSLVDVCTQESYQLMDEGFIGMIFSVFNSDPNKFGGRIQMICYQSQSVIIDCNVEKSHIEIPIQLVPSSYISDVCMNSVVQLPRFLCQEEQLAYQMANQVPLDYLTRLHNSSVYLRKMGQIAEVICGPLLKMLEERILNNEIKRKRLQERKKALTAIIEKTKSDQAKKAYEKLQKLQKQLESALKEQAKEKQNSNFGSEEQDSKVKELETEKLPNENEDLKESPSENQESFQIPSTQQEKTLLKDQEVPFCKEQEGCMGIDPEEVEFQDWQAELNEQEWQSSMLRIASNEMSQLGNFKTVSLSKETSGSKVPLDDIPKESLKTKQQSFTEEKQSKKQKVQEILDELEVIRSSGSENNLTLNEDKSNDVGKENQSVEQNIQNVKVSSPDQANDVLITTQILDSSKILDCIPMEISKNMPDVLDSPLSPQQVKESNCETVNIRTADVPVCRTFVISTNSRISDASNQNTDINLSLSSTDSKIYIEPISPPDEHSASSMSPC